MIESARRLRPRLEAGSGQRGAGDGLGRRRCSGRLIWRPTPFRRRRPTTAVEGQPERELHPLLPGERQLPPSPFGPNGHERNREQIVSEASRPRAPEIGEIVGALRAEPATQASYQIGTLAAGAKRGEIGAEPRERTQSPHPPKDITVQLYPEDAAEWTRHSEPIRRPLGRVEEPPNVDLGFLGLQVLGAPGPRGQGQRQRNRNSGTTGLSADQGAAPERSRTGCPLRRSTR